MKFELVPVPVSDLNRAKIFYADKLGFHVDHDTQPSDSLRLIQLTPPGSACSILLSTGLPEIDAIQPGSARGLHLVVADVVKARAMLLGQGVEAGEVIEYPDGVKFAGFSDPDGNSWLFQEMPWRAAEFEE